MIRFSPVIAAAALSGAAIALPAMAAPPTTTPATTPAGSPSTATTSSTTASLTIHFANIASPKGRILIALFDSQAHYDSGEPVRTLAADVVPASDPNTAAAPTSATATATITRLAPGRYGFKVYHDVNGDNTLNSNPFGMPIEPFAFSNNAMGRMGPARWADAAFDLVAPVTQTVTFR